ncbi:MAG: MarR family transcriptional regulator [Acutalibacteraceae bacterium]
MKNIDVLNMIDAKYALFGFFFAFHNRLQTAGDAFYEEITCKQFFLLACMNLFNDTAPTANDLAKVMGCSRQNVKEILTSLEKKELVSFSPCETDKRKRIVVLTEKAEKLAAKYREKETEFLTRLYDGVTDQEIKNAYVFLSKLEDNLKMFNKEINK